jgi:hypothetical protein
MKSQYFLKVCVFLLVLMTAGMQFLSGQLFSPGDKDLSLTVGYGTPWVFRYGYQTKLLPIGVCFDYGITDNLGPGVLSIGGFLGATTYQDELYNINLDENYGRKGTLLAVALRGTYHYQLTDEVDTYGFLHLGAGFESWNLYGSPPPDDTVDVSSQTRFVFGVGIGAKYYFSEKVCALAEIGFDMAYFKIGVGYRL